MDEAIAIAHEIGDGSMIARSLMWKSQILYGLGRFEDAARTLGHCTSLMAQGEHSFNKANTGHLIDLEMRLSRALSPPRFAQLRIEGTLL